MDAATLQARIYSGYGKAAQRIGYAFDLHRPTTSANPTDAGTKIATLPAAFTVRNDHKFSKAGAYKDLLWEGLFDGAGARVGDYLVNAQHGTYFIAAMQDQLPILCVRCWHIFDVVRAPAPAGVGVGPYNGTTGSSEVPVMMGWPGALLYNQRGRATEVGLPLDLPSPFYEVLLPAAPAAVLRTSDIVKDELDQRFVVAAAELSPLGWRLSAQIAVT